MIRRITLTLVCCLFGTLANAQNSYFVDKKGKKTIMRDDAIDVIMIDKRISYKEIGKTWEKYVTFKDLDYAIIGPSVFKSFRLNNKKKDEAFFILAEKSDKKLIGVAVEVTTTSSSGHFTRTKTFYRILVVDNNNMILSEAEFTSHSRDEKFLKGAAMAREHFGDCEALMSRLSASNEDISDILNSPVYINCK